MNAREQGFLLLTSQLGNPERKPLTVAQLRILAARLSGRSAADVQRELTAGDLLELGYGMQMAQRILGLLGDSLLLEHYLRRGAQKGCVPVTRVTPGYPDAVRSRLGLDSPGCLWGKGDLTLLQTPKLSLVGSRKLNPENRAFAREAGRQAALQGYTLVSGNAPGADQQAQNACLEAGGRVISVVADALTAHPVTDRVLYLSEEDYDQGFSAGRALSRNRVIHSLGEKTLVAQCGLGKGGTWDGTVRNLDSGWSPVFAFRDGSPASFHLEQRGASLISMEDLRDISDLLPNYMNFFDQ